MSMSFRPLTSGNDSTNVDRISTLIADKSGEEQFSEPLSDLPILASLSHTDPHLSAHSFSAEDFLISRSHTSLPDLRLELRDYLATLKEELVQLINDDYAAFISLSTDLRGEGTRLERLKYPLQGLKKEIEASLGQLKVIQETVQERLDERLSLREEKALLHLLLKLSESLARLESLLLISRPQDGTVDDLSNNPGLRVQTGLTHVEGNDERSRTSRVKHLSRVAAEFTQLLYHVEKARSEKCLFVNEIQWRVDRVKSTLSSDLDHLFATTLLSLGLGDTNAVKKAPNESDKARLRTDLKECLRTYDALTAWRDAEEVIRREIVKGVVKKTFFAGALSVPHSPLIPRSPFPTRTVTSGLLTPGTPYTPYTSRPRKTPFEPQFVTLSGSHLPLLDDTEDALAALYNKILRFVDRDLKNLMEVAEAFSVKHRQPAIPSTVNMNGSIRVDHPKDDGFEIMANVVWAEIGRAIMEELGSVVFAAGRPDDFRQHYVTTQGFLASLEFLAPSLHSVEAMRSHPTYLAFQRRWQLPVYFQLRWKDIVGRLEEALSKPDSASTSSKAGTSDFVTSQASAVFEAIRTSWSVDICIPEIGHRFWRLTLQILSRYRTWLEINQPPREPSAIVVAAMAAEKSGTGTTTPVSRASTPIPPSEPSNSVSDNSLLQHCGTMITDIMQLEKKVLDLWNTEISLILPDIAESEESTVPSDALKHSLAGLTGFIQPLASHVVAILTRRSCEALQLVRGIPSQYRAMSNKRMPTEPSHFVSDILKPVKIFLASIPNGLEHDLGAAWASEVFGAVCTRYITYFVAMKKTEESLRRLKKGKMSAFSLFGGGSPMVGKESESKDEERVRAQMVLDVRALGEDARSLRVDVDDHSVFRELETMAAQGSPDMVGV